MSPAKLPFPLDVYAHTLALEYGEARHLHFGIFSDSDTAGAYPDAQGRAEDALLTLMPPPPARLLEVGCGSGALARRLADEGYEVLALTPLAAEFEALKDLRQPGLRFALGGLSHLPVSEPFDVLILQQSSQYLDPLSLFMLAARHLQEGGSLLIADEFTLDDGERRVEPRPVLAHFLRMAHRCGFSVERQRDLGRQVAPGLSAFAAMLERHHAALIAEGDVSADQLQQLRETLRGMAARYADATLGYTLLDLRRSSPVADHPVFGDIHSFSTDEVPTLFERSFETGFDAEVWSWKYGKGRGRAVCARLEGELVGHYGGAPRDILYFGEPDRAIQICDVMVMPEYRSFVSRDTLFFKMAATFLELEVGNCAPHLLGVGFPNMRVLRVAQHLGLYDITDAFIEIRYPVTPQEDRLDLQVLPYDLNADEAASVVNALWSQMAGELSGHIVGVRDWDYWAYRYLSHPAWGRGHYRCLQIREVGSPEPLALVMLREYEGAQLLMDILGPRRQFPSALEALRNSLARESQSLRSRITRSHAETLALPGAQEVDLGIEIPCNIWTRGPDAAALRGAWWLTAGDMDFL